SLFVSSLVFGCCLFFFCLFPASFLDSGSPFGFWFFALPKHNPMTLTAIPAEPLPVPCEPQQQHDQQVTVDCSLLPSSSSSLSSSLSSSSSSSSLVTSSSAASSLSALSSSTTASIASASQSSLSLSLSSSSIASGRTTQVSATSTGTFIPSAHQHGAVSASVVAAAHPRPHRWSGGSLWGESSSPLSPLPSFPLRQRSSSSSASSSSSSSS
ncbi:hypothetical protein CAOG_08550, partial [Capsaspora owczarzaki ATCC 30864]